MSAYDSRSGKGDRAAAVEAPGRAAALSGPLGAVVFYAHLLLIVLAAIPYGTVEPWWEAVYEGAVFGLAALWVIEGLVGGRWFLPAHRIFLPVLLLVLYAFIQTLPILPPSAGAPGHNTWHAISADPYETRLSVLKLLALMLSGVMLLRYATTRSRLRAIVYTVIGVAVASALFGIFRQTTQHAQGFLLAALKPGNGFAQFINKNHFAFLMEMALGLALGIVAARGTKRDRALIYLALALPLWTALIMSYSRGGIFAMMAEVILLALIASLTWARHAGMGRKEETERGLLLRRSAGTKALRVALVLAIVAVIFVGAVWMGGEPLASRLETVQAEMSAESTDGASRKEIWRATLRMIKENPVAGVGFNGYYAAVPTYHAASGSITPRQAHNDYLELLASGGLIGLALASWFVFALIKTARSTLRSADAFRRAASLGALAGLFGAAVHSAVDFGLHITINALVFVALTVIACAREEKGG